MKKSVGHSPSPHPDVGLSLPALAARKGKDKKKEVPRGTPVLWRNPGNVSALDLFHGPGGRAMKPDLSRLTFIEEEEGGYSKKYRVKDGRGRVRVAKIGKEAQPETAATRLLWAILSRPSDRQIADAFRAANYSPAEVRLLSAEVRQRINELAGRRR